MMNEVVFRTVMRDSEEILEEKRSEFIAAAKRVSNEEEAVAFVKERRRLHPDARHTVFAYLLRTGVARYSDDSEPQGTAGLPTLEAIRRAGVEDTVVVTTRYFGGILLGTGGLTRAYASAAHLALVAAGVAEYVPFDYFLLDCTYSDHQKLENELARLGVRKQMTDFSERVRMEVGMPADHGELLCRRVVELTAGRCVPQKTRSCMDLKAE